MERAMKGIAVLAMVVFLGAWPAFCAETTQGGAEGGTAVQSQEDDGQCAWGEKGSKRHGPKEMFKDLGLSPEQEAQLKAKREADKEANKAVREQMKAKMQALHAEIAKPGTKRADVDALLGEVSALKAQMFAQKIDGIFAMKEILTPEQFAKMETKRQEHMDKMKNRKGGWGERGKGPGPDQEKE